MLYSFIPLHCLFKVYSYTHIYWDMMHHVCTHASTYVHNTYRLNSPIRSLSLINTVEGLAIANTLSVIL